MDKHVLAKIADHWRWQQANPTVPTVISFVQPLPLPADPQVEIVNLLQPPAADGLLFPNLPLMGGGGDFGLGSGFLFA